jgi:hypothetical protein
LFLGQEENVQLHPESWDSLLQGLCATTSPILAGSNPKGRFRPKRTDAAFWFLCLKIGRHPTLYTSKRSRRGNDFPWLRYVCVGKSAMPPGPRRSARRVGRRAAALAVTCRSRPGAAQRAGDGIWDVGGSITGGRVGGSITGGRVGGSITGGRRAMGAGQRPGHP